MQSFIRTTKRVRLSSPPKLRHYTPSSALLRPTALHRATEASDLAKHPESGTTQEKKPDVKHNRHWTEANSTISEADVSRMCKEQE